MLLSEETLKAAALACRENAESLSAEAKLLADNDHGARAVALAVLGLEEFAKVIGYTVAALSQEPSHVLIKKLRHLTYHEVKHLLAQSSEYAQIVTEDWADGVEWQTGFRPSIHEQFVARFRQLARGGLGALLEAPREARAFFKMPVSSATGGNDIDVPFGPDMKNAALYVDVTPDGQVKTPSRVAGWATSEILGLDWFLEQYADLVYVLKDDAGWKRLKAAVRP